MLCKFYIPMKAKERDHGRSATEPDGLTSLLADAIVSPGVAGQC